MSPYNQGSTALLFNNILHKMNKPYPNYLFNDTIFSSVHGRIVFAKNPELTAANILCTKFTDRNLGKVPLTTVLTVIIYE